MRSVKDPLSPFMVIPSLAPAGNFSGEGKWGPPGEGMEGGRRVGGSGGAEPPDAGEVFKKFVKNKWKIYNFFKLFKKISRFFQHLFEILSNFWHLDNLENWEICICRGFGGGAPDACEFLEIWVEKSMETSIYENLH